MRVAHVPNTPYFIQLGPLPIPVIHIIPLSASSVHPLIFFPVEPLCSFGSYCVSLQEVAQRWQSRAAAPIGNDGENGQGSSEEGQSCPCHVRVSKQNVMLHRLAVTY